MTTRLTALLRSLWPPAAFGAVMLGIWQLVVRGFDLQPYFLVAPSDIYAKFVSDFSNIWDAMVVSGTNAAFGLLFGAIIGVLVAFMLSRFRILDELVMPMSIAINAIPAFVLVSVFNNMFSSTSEVPRRLMVTLVVFFVVLVNVSKGLRQVQPVHSELMKSYAASGWEIMRKVRVPNAIPYLFTALRISAPLSVIYAYVSEYFGGSQNGLGHRISSNISNSKNALGWAYVLGACLLGLAFYMISIAMEAVATPGGAGSRNREGS
ncbi:MAG: ABC transporter permease subunit [Actinomycetota bacterium]|nr:ABC transporter permease subunit [Actinomycetota bacterium]